MFTPFLIKLNLFSSFYFDLTRRYITLFAIKSQQSGMTVFEKLKRNYSLKRKKHSVRVTRENGCMLEEAATASYTRKRNVPHFY